MTLPSWWQVTTPHKDIREGKISESIFAADLGDVVSGKAPLEYKDAGIFFQRTYLTTGLRNLLENVLSRLHKGKGDPVIQLLTPFGGGKTHALIALYHAIANREKVKHLDSFAKLSEPKGVKVVVFVGTRADPIKGKTPWGEMAHQLGVYSKVKEHDEKHRSPGKDMLSEILGDNTVLILMDELVEYAVKARDYADQISAFSQELTETVKSTDNCCLICTLPSSAPYGEAGERALRELQIIFGRIQAIYQPVEGVEIYEIIRKRLFDDIGDEKIQKQVAQAYFDLYQKLGVDIPSEVKEIEYRERIEHAYPFHPELIDVLYERWGSFATFQRTRGVLRLLADVIADQYKQKTPTPTIQSSLMNLGTPGVRGKLIECIGNEYNGVIDADISGKKAQAHKIDKEMGSEYEKYGIASAIATSVFLYSFSGAEKKGTTLPWIRVALLREGIPHTIVGDAISKLEEELWYFHSEKKQYSFKNQPNLNRVIMDKEEAFTDDKIEVELKEITQKNIGRSLETYLWPENTSDIPDNKNLKLAILAPDDLFDSTETKQLVSELYEKAGIGFRVYKNTLFVLTTDNSQYVPLFKSLKRFMALRDIQNDKDLLERLTKESMEELKKRLKEAEREIPFRILTAYRHLSMLAKSEIEWKDMGIPTIGTSVTITERVMQYLKDQERILSRLTAKYITDTAFAKEENEKTLREIYELSLKTPGMPIVENEGILFNAIKDGVKTGLVGVRQGSEVLFKEDAIPTIDSVVLRGETAKKHKEMVSAKLVKEPKTAELEKEELVIKRDGIIKKIAITAKIPWDKLSDIVKGVIKPLKDKGNPPEITLSIKSEGDFDRTTLDTKVKETLHQIGAEIEEWKEE